MSLNPKILREEGRVGDSLMNKKRKRVCFVCYGLGIGGIEKCLVNLINNMSEELYTIDLLLMNPELDLRNDIKRKINYIDWFEYY